MKISCTWKLQTYVVNYWMLQKHISLWIPWNYFVAFCHQWGIIINHFLRKFKKTGGNLVKKAPNLEFTRKLVHEFCYCSYYTCVCSIQLHILHARLLYILNISVAMFYCSVQLFLAGIDVFRVHLWTFSKIKHSCGRKESNYGHCQCTN